MAQEKNPELSYEKITDLSVDWGCNPNDGNKKFAGEVVQEFIKSLLAKITEVDTSLDKESTNAIANSVVATLMENIENRTLSSFDYDIDSDDSVLKLTAYNKSGEPITTIDIPFLGGGSGESTASKIKLTATTDQSMVKEGGKAILTYSYDHVNADGASDGIKANIIVTVKVGATTTFEQTYNGVGAGTYTLDLSDYLRAGTVDIYVKADCTTETGDKQSKQAYTSINVITLQLTSSFNIAASFAKGGYDDDDIIEIPYTVTGSGAKNISMYLDGNATPVVQTVSKSGTTNGSFMIQAASLNAGRHTIQLVAERDDLLSDSIYMDILKGGEDAPFIGAKIIFTDGRIFHENHLTPVLSCVQYEQLSFQYAVYNPDTTPALMSEYRNDLLYGTRSVPRVSQNWIGRFASDGNVNMLFKCKDTEYSFSIDVAASDVTFEKATQGMRFELSAAGRSNDEANPDQWSDGDVDTTFGFINFKSPSGWNGDSLVLENGAKAVINDKIFATDAAANGMTVIVEYRATNVALRDASIISCISDGRGFDIQAEKVSMLTGSSKTITDEDGNSTEMPVGVEMSFASDSWHQVAFVVHKRSDGRLLELYRNGGRCKADIYSEADTFLQDNAQGITLDSTFARLEVRSVMAYNRALSDDELLGNFVVSRPDPEEMMRLAEDNDIMTEDGSAIDMDKLIKKQKGVMLIVRKGGLQEVNSANDKKKKFLADVYIYTPWGDQIVYKNIYISIQGTSSTKYAPKNFSVYFMDGENIELWINGVLQTDLKIPIVPGDNPVGIGNLKCDFTDSSMTQNTGFAKVFNNIMKASGSLTPPQRVNSNYRTAINGWPCDVFSAESLDEVPTYFGQYNFNNAKADWASILGLSGVEGIDDSKVIALEFLNNSEKLCLFQSDEDIDQQLVNEFDNALEFNWPAVKNWASANEYQQSSIRRFWKWIRDCVPAGADTAEYKDISSFVSEKFRSEAHQHMDVRFMCKYYTEGDYHGAIDQRAKNIIAVTFDGEIWYFFYYDGDCRDDRNDGVMAYDYTIDRETWDVEKSKYAFEGHDSILWCLILANFEDELRAAASELREKMTVETVLSVLDDEICDNWSIRQYNKSGELKYIKPAIEGVDVNGVLTKYPQIYALKGDKKSHRRHRLINRYALLDGRYSTSAYRSDNIDMYMTRALTDEPNTIDLTAHEVFYFGYGTNNTPDIQETQRVEGGQVHRLIFSNAFALNDPIRIYGASRARELDFRGSANNLTGDLNLNKCTQLRRLDISTDGAGSKGWCMVLDSCKLLEHLDVTNQPDARTGTLSSTEINLSNQSRLQTLLASGTKAQSIVLAPGAPVTRLACPETLTTLTLENLPLLQSDGLTIDGYDNIATFRFTQCPGLDWESILARCSNVKRIRVTGINATGDGSMLEKYMSIGGIDADGNATDTCALVGTYQLTQFIEGSKQLEYKLHYPELNILQPPYTMIESDDSIPDEFNISNTDNKTGYAYDKSYVPSGHINIIRSKVFRCLMKKVADNSVGICQLHNLNSNFFADAADPTHATPALLDGSMGDLMVYMPHYWYKGINDNLNNKHYTCFSSNYERPPIPEATVILFDAIQSAGRVRANYKLVAGSTSLDASFVSDKNFSVCSVDVSGYKKVRFPTVPDGGTSICSVFTDAAGNVLKTISIDGTRFTEGMYLISEIPEGADRLNFTIKTIAEFDKVVLSNSDKIEDMEPDWVEHTHCLIAALKATIVDSKIRSIITGGAGANNITQADFLAYAIARKLQLVDYEMHKDVANLFYAIYGRRNSQAQCGRGTDSTTRVLGVTAPAGMRDTIVVTAGSTYCWFVESVNEYGDETTVQLISPNFLGLESWWGNISEWTCKVGAPGTPAEDVYKWYIEMPDGSTRKVRSATHQDKFFAAAHHGKYCDIIAAGTATASETTRYCDYYYYMGSTNRVVYRSGSRAGTYGGVACSYAHYDSGTASAVVGSRLAFRGDIRIINSVEEFKAI